MSFFYVLSSNVADDKHERMKSDLHSQEPHEAEEQVHEGELDE